MVTEINSVEAWAMAPDAGDGDEDEEDATTDVVEEEGIDETVDDEPGCKSTGS